MYFADYCIGLCKCGVNGPCCCSEVLKCLVSCLGFLVYKETERLVSVQKVCSCHASLLDSCFCLAVTFISVRVMPTASKVALTEPVLNAATHKWNSRKHFLLKCIFIVCRIWWWVCSRKETFKQEDEITWKRSGRIAAALGTTLPQRWDQRTLAWPSLEWDDVAGWASHHHQPSQVWSAYCKESVCSLISVCIWGGRSGQPLFTRGIFCRGEGLPCMSRVSRGASDDGVQRMGSITDLIAWVLGKEPWGCIHRAPGQRGCWSHSRVWKLQL